MKILITGATGFIGRHVCERLSGHSIRVAVRDAFAVDRLPKGVDHFEVGSIGPETNWSRALHGVDAVVHLAARAHVLNETSADPLAEFRKVNRQGTVTLAKAAKAAGVKRFVFMSSIGVNGNGQGPDYSGAGYRGTDDPQPHDLYAISKREAEDELARIEGLEIVNIRPPLVYGPAVPGNMRSLLGIVWKGVPLPLASAKNRRSFVGVRNLADFVAVCTESPAAAGKTLTVADPEVISTPELLTILGRGLEKPAKLLPFPVGLASFAAKVARKQKAFDSLFGSLVVDSSQAYEVLGWKAPHALGAGMLEMAQHYRTERMKD